MSRRLFLTYLALVILSVTMSFAAGYLIRDRLILDSGDFPVLNQAYNILLENGINPPPADPAIEYGMIRGMVDAYGDPFTTFVEPIQHELDSNDLQGSFGGIGVQLIRESDGRILLYPIAGGPAAEVGINDADQLVRVDNLDIVPEISIQEVQAAIRGPVGDPVQIGIFRGNADGEFSFTIRRGNVALPSVTWRKATTTDQVGIIKVNLIAASTPDEIQSAVEDLESQGATHFVLDLRDNNGGLLDAGIDTARLFLQSGEIIQQQYAGRSVETFDVNSPGPLADIPLVVLINQNTASAAEIVAGALQARKRANLVGVPTFGKDTIQLVFDLLDGSSLRVTAARWWIPGIELSLADHGLQPDNYIQLEGSEVDMILQFGIEELLLAE